MRSEKHQRRNVNGQGAPDIQSASIVVSPGTPRQIGISTEVPLEPKVYRVSSANYDGDIDRQGKMFMAFSDLASSTLVEEVKILDATKADEGNEQVMKVFKLAVLRSAATMLANGINIKRQNDVVARLLVDPDFVKKRPVLFLLSKTIDYTNNGHSTTIDGFSINHLLHDILHLSDDDLRNKSLLTHFNFLAKAAHAVPPPMPDVTHPDFDQDEIDAASGIQAMSRTVHALIGLDVDRDIFSASDVASLSQQEAVKVKQAFHKAEELVAKMNTLRYAFQGVLFDPDHARFAGLSELLMSHLENDQVTDSVWTLIVLTGVRLENLTRFYRRTQVLADEGKGDGFYAHLGEEMVRIIEGKHMENPVETDILTDSELDYITSGKTEESTVSEGDLLNKVRLLNKLTREKSFHKRTVSHLSETGIAAPFRIGGNFEDASSRFRVSFEYKKEDNSRLGLYVDLYTHGGADGMGTFDWNALTDPDRKPEQKAKVIAASAQVLDSLIEDARAAKIQSEETGTDSNPGRTAKFRVSRVDHQNPDPQLPRFSSHISQDLQKVIPPTLEGEIKAIVSAVTQGKQTCNELRIQDVKHGLYVYVYLHSKKLVMDRRSGSIVAYGSNLEIAAQIGKKSS